MELRLKKGAKLHYFPDVSMSLSFPGLVAKAEDTLGSVLKEGDVVVFDNKKKNRRKILHYFKGGRIIHYLDLKKNEGLSALRDGEGVVLLNKLLVYEE